MYMDLIFDKYLSFQVEAPWGDQVLGQLKLLQMDAGFLKMLCLCCERWDKQRLGSMITHLELIWTIEHKGRPSIISRLIETWPLDVQHFHSLAFELEGIIHQCKIQIEGWCKYLLQYSSMQCKSFSTFYQIWGFLNNIQWNINTISSYRAKNIVPFKKQVHILKNKLVFLDKALDNIEGPEKRIFQDKARHDMLKIEVLQFMNFVHAFANGATCLTCLYWARAANDEEIAAELNILLFYMLHKFTPFAPDIIPLYIGIINLQASDPFLLGETVASFIDFLFEHLSTVLKDQDYLILRDKLIFIFTFLSGPPVVGDDSIRSQIDDLFHQEDAYLLPFDEIKRDFSDKKIALSDFMIKIQIAIAMIIQLYCGFSDSWSRLEAERLYCIYFVSVERELSSIEKHAPWADLVGGQLKLYKMELRFLRMFLRCFATWDDTDDEEIREKLRYILTSLQGIWGKNGLPAPHLHAIQKGDISHWHLLTSELDGNIMLSKVEIEAWWVNLYHCSFRCKPSAYNIEDLSKFMDSIIDNLNDLVRYRADKIIPFKKQIDTLKEKLIFLQNFLKLTVNCVDSKKLEEFYVFVRVLANDAACLTFLYGAQEDANDKLATEMNLMLSHMLQKIKPGTSKVARLYFRTLEVIYLKQSDSFLFGQTASSFLDLFIEDPMKRDFQNLQDDIIFLLTFLNDPPNGNAAELTCCQMDVLFWEGVCGLLPYEDMRDMISSRKKCL